VEANPDAHTRECALKCSAGGYGILTPDKKFLKFDSEMNSKISGELKASSKQDHLRVDVTGDVQGDTLKVTSVKLLQRSERGLSGMGHRAGELVRYRDDNCFEGAANSRVNDQSLRIVLDRWLQTFVKDIDQFSFEPRARVSR
jgi:hypothetical protein